MPAILGKAIAAYSPQYLYHPVSGVEAALLVEIKALRLEQL